MNARHMSTSSERYTPSEIVEMARDSMGSIDLDPASTEFVNENLVKASAFFDEEMDGLKQEWYGNVFVNPPGDKRGLGPKRFWEHAANAYNFGEVDNLIFIGFSLEQFRSLQNSNTIWHPINFTVCFPKSRICFLKLEDGEFVSMNKPGHANYITLLSDSTSVKNRFKSNFSELGLVSEGCVSIDGR